MAGLSKPEAIKKVDGHVAPRGCFLWELKNDEEYEPIRGEGCAHWVAHENGWDSGIPGHGGNACEKGYFYRVADLIDLAGREVPARDVKVGNVWIVKDCDDSHCGIVSKVTAAEGDADPTIEIEHCSSRQGGVVKNTWPLPGHSGGTFYEGLS